MALKGDARLILIVEDEWLLRTLTANEFRAAGWRVFEADSGEAALKFLEAGNSVDAIFTDVQLAGRLTGLDVGERCRDVLPGVLIVYTSGGSLQQRELRGCPFFGKPYDTDAVIDTCLQLT